MKRTIIVTGGTKGIGLAIVKQFLEENDTVITCSRSGLWPKGTPEKIKKAVSLYKCNVADPADVKIFFAPLKKIDVLVNNAGVAGENSLKKSDDPFHSKWHEIINTNLNGTYYCSKAALPLLVKNRSKIINIASVLGLKGVPDQTAYCAAKHGVVGFTKSLAHYLAPQKITVNAICPGWTLTDMAQSRFKDLKWTRKKAAAGIPIGRILDPSEIAAAVSYLATPQAAGITGQTLVIDGGSLA